MTEKEGGTAEKGAGGDDRTKAAAEGLKKLLEVLAPQPKAKDGATTDVNTPVVDELYGAISSGEITAFAENARSAVERYRNAMRWLVGAVGAIGVVLFGSTAFTEGNPFDNMAGLVGLALASFGLVLVLTAATLVFEPEDASLGELAADFKRAERKFPISTGTSGDPEASAGWGRRAKLHTYPRMAAIWRLKEIVEGSEHGAHLGPGHKTVVELLESISTQQAARVVKAKELAGHRRAMAANASKRTLLSADFAPLLEASKGLDKTKTELANALDLMVIELLAEKKGLRVEADQEFTDLATKQGELDQTDFQLGMDLLHRSVVLTESGVAQLRGTFRLSRRCLLVGSLLTLLGTLLYVAGVKDDDADEKESARQVRAGTLVVAAGSRTADEFIGRCIGRPLSVTYFGESTPKVGDAFKITVSAPEECAKTYSIPGGRGPDEARLSLEPPVTVPKAQ